MTDDEPIEQEREKLLAWMETFEAPDDADLSDDAEEGPILEQMIAGLLWQVAALRVRVEALEVGREG